MRRGQRACHVGKALGGPLLDRATAGHVDRDQRRPRRAEPERGEPLVRFSPRALGQSQSPRGRAVRIERPWQGAVSETKRTFDEP